MKFNYLTDTSEKSLAPFFSSVILSAVFKGLLSVSGFIVVFWPWKKGLAEFITEGRIPLLFFTICTVTVIVHSYINLRCGRGELIERKYVIPEYEYAKKVVTFEKEEDFLQYGLIEFLLHTLFLLVPFFPLLLLVTSISGLSLTVFAKACSVVFTASLLCRLFGFMTHLFWGRTGGFGHFLTRVFLILFMFVTVFIFPFINPVLILYDLNKSSSIYTLDDILQRSHESLQPMGLSFMTTYSSYMATVLFVIVIFVIVNQILVKYYKHD